MKNEVYTPPAIVPWPVVNGERVTTNGIMEEALGLDAPGMGFGGWCREGFYTHAPEALKIRIGEVDWERVAFVKKEFDIKAGRGTAVFTDCPVYWVTELRFKRLMRACLKTVSTQSWGHECYLATKVAAKAGKSCSSGSLD